MIIYAISDLDVLRSNIDKFLALLKNAKEPDLLLFAGDMYEYRNPKQYKEIVDHIKWKCPIVAVFGNREFSEDENDIKKCAGRIKFLDDESTTFKIKGETVGIVGSRGCLDYPMFWQVTETIGILDTYDRTAARIEKLLSGLKTDIKILLTHYAPTQKTLEGEEPELYPVLGSKILEKVLIKTKVTLAIHGHAHYGIRFAFVGKVPVYNVSYPITKAFTIIDTDKLPKV